MIYGSVCSGIEAATVAWHPLGWTPSFFSEIEPFPRAVLAHRWPDVPVHGDFTTIQPGDYAAIDLLVGGTPCQSFSVAGLRGGLDDDRGNLALEYLRLADRLRPKWLVWENVPGVLSSSGGRDFGAILGGMVELGYGFAYRVLDAQHLGVPQRRRRVFVVGHSGDWRPAAAVLFERHSLQGHHAPRREAPEDTAGTLAGGARRRGGYSADDIPAVTHSLRADGFDASEDGTGRGTPLVPLAFDTTQVTSQANRSNPKPGDPCHPLAAGAHPPAVAYGANNTSGPLAVAAALAAHGGPHGLLDFASETFVAQAYRTSGNCGAWSTGDKVDTLSTGTDPAHHVLAFSAKDHGADAGPVAPTLRAGGHTKSHANAGVMPAVAIPILEPGRRSGRSTDDVRIGLGVGADGDPMYTLPAERPHGVATAAAVRRLTPRECERLQGFPDDYSRVPLRNANGKLNGKWAKDGPRYKALGNSMAVPVMAWIGRRIDAVERLSKLPVSSGKI